MLWSRELKFYLISAAFVTSAIAMASAHADIREDNVVQPNIIKVGSVRCFQNGVEVLSEKDRYFDTLWVSGNNEIVRFERDGTITLMASQDGLACVLSYERRPTYE